MNVLHRLLRFFSGRRPPPPVAPADDIGNSLRAAIAADVRAKTTNVQTHEARVNAMIEDFFSKYGGRDAGLR